jgi:hypothetical protein
MAAGVTVLGPYPPKQFDKAGTAYTSSGSSATLDARMTADVAALGNASNVVSVEPIMVLGNVHLVVYMKA